MRIELADAKNVRILINHSLIRELIKPFFIIFFSNQDTLLQNIRKNIMIKLNHLAK